MAKLSASGGHGGKDVILVSSQDIDASRQTVHALTDAMTQATKAAQDFKAEFEKLTASMKRQGIGGGGGALPGSVHSGPGVGAVNSDPYALQARGRQLSPYGGSGGVSGGGSRGGAAGLADWLILGGMIGGNGPAGGGAPHPVGGMEWSSNRPQSAWSDPRTSIDPANPRNTALQNTRYAVATGNVRTPYPISTTNGGGSPGGPGGPGGGNWGWQPWDSSSWQANNLINRAKSVALSPGGKAVGLAAAGATAAAHGISSIAHNLANANLEAAERTSHRIEMGIATPGGNSSDVGGTFTRNMIEAIPVIGKMAKSLRELDEAVVHSAARISQASVSFYERGNRQTSFEASAQGAASRAITGINWQQIGISSTAATTGRYAQGLNANDLARYRGVSGDLYRQIDALQAEAEGTREATLHIPGEVAEARKAASSATAAAKVKQTKADVAHDAWLTAEKRAFAQRRGGQMNPTDEQAAIEANRRAQIAAGAAHAAGDVALQKEQNLQQKIELQRDAEHRNVNAQAALRAGKLGIKERIVEGGVGRAINYGMNGPAAEVQDARLIELIGQGARLTPEQNARAMAIPGAADVLGPIFKKRSGGLVDAALNALRPADQQGFAGQPLANQEDEVNRERAKNRAKEAADFQKIGEQFATPMAKSVTRVMEMVIKMFDQKLKAEMQKLMLANKIGG